MKEVKKIGRPKKSPCGSVKVMISIRANQREKLRKLGGSIWIQKMIDEEEEKQTKGMVYSLAGLEEVGNTRICEACFDRITRAPDEDEEY